VTFQPALTGAVQVGERIVVFGERIVVFGEQLRDLAVELCDSLVEVGDVSGELADAARRSGMISVAISPPRSSINAAAWFCL
jgi:hypothetical protein